MDTMQGLKRTKYCGEFSTADAGKTVVACGWVQRIRDKGMLVFIDLRDRSGIIQLAFDDKTETALREKAQGVRSEFVLMAQGEIRRRESVNRDIATGEIELYVTELRILAKSQTPPFEITDRTNVNEELRLKYRYLDLRRGEMQHALMMRHRIVKVAHDYYSENGFIEIETPELIKSSPEGARDYLVPSRVHPGSFYALPQSPQQYKQLLMLAGYDRYMQIARCFRDEDLRADRQPEFTQIDLEMSFVDEDDVMTVNEGFMARVFKEALNFELKTPFIRMPYAEAMSRFGSDKPDTRFALELCDLSPLLTECEFKVFRGALDEGGSVRALCVKGGAEKLSRKEIDKLVELVKTYRAKGLAYTRLTADGESSSYEKFLSDTEKAAIREKLDAQTGDVILIVADAKNDTVCESLGALRCELGARLGLIAPGVFNALWVTDFPLFEFDEEENRYSAKHHPFTHPAMADLDLLETRPGDCRARAYDMVLNGCEVGGGSIRINDFDLQQRMFHALGFDDATAYEQFGFLMDAFRYGAPPHGGMAYGLDRLVMLMLEKDSIRDVIAFPKVQNASELMTQCPAVVEEKSLTELGIRVIEQEKI